MTTRRLCCCLTGGLLLLTSGNAMAYTKASAAVALDGGYSSNPYNSRRSSTSSGTLAATVTPSVIISAPTGSVRLSGMVRHTEYAQLYSGTTDYNVAASSGFSISPLTSINGNASFSSTVRNSLYPARGSDVVSPDDPVDPEDPIIDDPSGATNFARRTNRFSGNVGLSTTLSPYDSLSVTAIGSKVSISGPSDLARGYSNYGGGLTYSRLVATDTTVGLSVNVTRSQYQREGTGSSTQIAPSLVFSTMLAPRLSLRATAGVTFSDTELLLGSRKRSSFSGSINLCNKGDRSNLCANASRSVSPSSVAGTSTVTLAGLSYGYQLDPRSRIAVNLSYTNAQSLAGLGRVRSAYGRANVNYSRKLTQRLSGVVSLIYSNPFNSTVQRNANVSGTVGIRYSLGEL